MVEFHVETKKGIILRRSLRVSEIKEVRENSDGTAFLRISDFDKNGNYFGFDTVELYNEVMKDIENEQCKHLSRFKGTRQWPGEVL
ncbi:MAG: hypothetical protein J6B56_06110 [Clostridia bacterium]|nr:hypothetical protein [Clostridia bacterium]